MTTHIWPLAGLRLTTNRLELRLPAEAELFALASLAPDDLEVDPAWPAPPGAALPTQSAVLQWYWRALGEWKVDHWRLPLAVWFEGALVGFQELEAERFAALGTVESSSWLVPDARGLGIGKEMRGAVLGLAFDHLDATAAASGAWQWNAESLGVSRALGYSDNGWFVHEHAGRVGRQRRVILEKADWNPAPWPTEVVGLEPCRPWFGPSPTSAPGTEPAQR